MTESSTGRPAFQKIAYYCIATHMGGAERSLLDLMTRVEAQSLGWYRPWVILPHSEGPLVDAIKEREIPHSILPMPRGFLRMSRSRPLRSLLMGALTWPAVRRYVGRLHALVAAERPALIHTSAIKCHALSARLGKTTPVLWHLRDILAGGTARTLLRRLRSRPGVHVISNSYATALAFDTRKENPHVVYNGIDTDHFVPGPRRDPRFRDQFDVGEDVPIIGIVGVLQRGKGIDKFIEMAALLREDGIDARYVIVGDDIYDTGRDRGLKHQLEAQVEALALGDVVTFVGYDPDAARVMQGLDILVSASTSPESFGRVVVEAMASGVSVAASALGGVLEIVDDHYCGWLFPPGDPSAMARAVRGILADPEMRATSIARARERVIERFSIGNYIAAVVRSYDRILNRDSEKLS